MGDTRDILQRLKAIEQRNNKVELDKAWEISWYRRILIAVLTYGVVFAYLSVIGGKRPVLDALVPAAGYLLSTLVVRFARKKWEANRR